MNAQIIYFQSQVFHLTFMFVKSTGFKFFTKVMGGDYIYCCSSHISFKPSSHLNHFILRFCAKYFEVKLRNQAKLDYTESFLYLFVCILWVPVPIVQCYSGNYTLNCVPIQFLDFSTFPYFIRCPKIFEVINCWAAGEANCK